MPRLKNQTAAPQISKQKPGKNRKPSGGVLDRLEDAWGFQDRISMNLYGRSGVGKTVFWATFPGPILAVVCSGGNKPGELKSVNTPEYREKITPRVVTSSEDINDLLAIAEDYETVVLDHATGLQDLKLKEILGLEELPEQITWGTATQQQYGQLAIQMKETLRAFLNLEANIVLVAQEREFNTEGGGDLLEPYVASALTPSVVGWLGPACDFICQMYRRPIMGTTKVGGKEVSTGKVVGVEYVLRTEPHPVYATKFRMPKGTQLQDIVDPSYAKVMDLVGG